MTGAGGAPRGWSDYDVGLRTLLVESDIFIEHTYRTLRLLPLGWHSFEDVPVRPRKARITAAFDADLVDWFRLMGEGWHARINHVLRVFMLAVQSKEILTERDYDWRYRELKRRR